LLNACSEYNRNVNASEIEVVASKAKQKQIISCIPAIFGACGEIEARPLRLAKCALMRQYRRGLGMSILAAIGLLLCCG
jgi:hypothetical protein